MRAPTASLLRPLAALLCLAAVASPAGAWASPADPSSPDLGRALTDLPVTLAFIDADGDSQPDASAPDEPAYLDLDGSKTVSYGDLRLTPFGPYPAGTLVDVANRDVARELTAGRGWFGVTQGSWFADLDGDGRLSVADVHVDGANAGSKATPSTAGAGQALRMPPVAASPRGHLDHLDADGDGHWAVGSPLFVDADGDGTSSLGDLRLAPAGFGLDAGPSPAELQAAMDAALASAAAATAAREELESRDPVWTLLQAIGILLGLAALAGLAYLQWRMRAPAAPRNPFK